MQTIHAAKTVSVTELKRNFSAILGEAANEVIAVLNHNKPEAYLLSAASYERLLDHLEEMEDRKLAAAREKGPFVKVELDDL